ncbi:hypothetical protein BABINDRAFT_139994 [Babjeviella inositovora NRRL Y-12698]|uniref:Uncharacterized protein n=1 Tax=Babjeviella inositovora NRRL Y-12698 TaxID=984486 RepID=A0A1E3QQV4_9ASCO|nr:uncharacterized protein BABINDRAFT_139994 [Babjeviella inositovora NRRL Y-12698]ODQ80086.1 hypothetical protein BABINDRAFT_139994 [Babjeviella inositovora NRRL Y-12698]
MNTHEIPLFSNILPLEIVEKIVSYLPLPVAFEVAKSENASLASVARRRYYSNIKLTFYEPPDDGYSHMGNEVLSMKISRFEALVNSNTFDQLHIKKLFIDVYTHVENFTFLREKVFTKASSIVTDVILKFTTDGEWYWTFSWDWLPPLPLVQERIREISVWYPYIDPDVTPLPSSLRKLDLQYHYQYGDDDDDNDEIAPRIVFPPNLQEFVSKIPWGSMSAYTNLPSTLRRLVLEDVLGFSVEAFNELNLPNLKYLRLKTIPDVTEINEKFEFPSLLENLKLYELTITNFEQRKLPPRLQKISIARCPLKKFRVDTFPNSVKELILDDIDLPSSEIRILKFPPRLISLQIARSQLTSLDFVSSLPGSLKSLCLHSKSLGILNKTDESSDTARTCQVKFPEGLQELNLERNRSLFILYSPRNLIFPPNLKDLNLGDTDLSPVNELNLPPTLNSLRLCSNSLVSLEGLDLPPGLNSLDLSNNNFVSVDELNLPPGLTFLDLNFNSLISVKGLGLPPSLISLSLCSNNLVSVNELDLPLTLTSLDLSFNSIERLSKRLPDNIQLLNLEHNQLKKLVNFHLPVNCTELKLSYNPLQKLQTSNANDPKLKLRDFCLNEVAITALCDISPLPQGLTDFSINNTNIGSLSGILFPAGLICLCAYNDQIVSLENVEFPPHLEELCLLRNQISSLANICFPDSLLKLELDKNKFMSIDDIQLPPKLKELDFAWNAISAINELQLPESLERLTLMEQRCDIPLNRVSTRGDSSMSSSSSEKKGLSSLAGLTKLPPKLEYLNLYGNSLSGQAVQHLVFPASWIRLLIYDNSFDDYYQWKEKIKQTHPRVSFD